MVLWGQGVIPGSMAFAASSRPQERDAETHYLQVVALGLGQASSIWGGWGGVEGWSRLGQGYDRVFSHLSKPRNNYCRNVWATQGVVQAPAWRIGARKARL